LVRDYNSAVYTPVNQNILFEGTMGGLRVASCPRGWCTETSTMRIWRRRADMSHMLANATFSVRMVPKFSTTMILEGKVVKSAAVTT
jgi:hypothetical protein